METLGQEATSVVWLRDDSGLQEGIGSGEWRGQF